MVWYIIQLFSQRTPSRESDVLADIAHEEHAQVVLLRESEQLRPLPIGFESRFIADHNGVPQFTPLLRVAQEVLNRSCLGKPFTSQHSCCRCCGSDGEDSVARFTQSALHFSQRRRFSGSCDTAEAEDPIARAEN
jgi:hypothetical protein